MKRRRHDRADKSRGRQEEREFLPAALEILESPPSPTARLFTRLICLFFAGALAWSWFGRIEIHAVAQGRVVPTGNVKVIQPLEPAKVLAIYVRDGQRVRAGDLLLELDPTEAAATRLQAERELEAARASAAASRAILTALAEQRSPRSISVDPALDIPLDLLIREQRVMQAAFRRHQAELESLEAQIRQKQAEKQRIEQTLTERRHLVAVLEERVAQRQALLDRGVSSRNEYLEVASVLHENAADLAAESGAVLETNASIAALERQRNELEAKLAEETARRLSELERSIDGYEQELVKAETRERRNVLTAPVDGRIQQLAVHTLGQVVTTGQQMMIVVPDGVRLEVEAMVLNRDKGFVAEGQDAVVKLEAFPFTKYGFIKGTVRTLSSDAVPSGAAARQGNAGETGLEGRGDAERGAFVFPATVELEAESIFADGREISLTPGMTATVEIKTGDRRLIEYVLTPLLRYGDEALRER